MIRVVDAFSNHLSCSRYATRLIEAKPALAAELDARGDKPFTLRKRGADIPEHRAPRAAQC